MRRIAFAVLALVAVGLVSGVSAYTGNGDITADETWGPSDGTITIRTVNVKSGATLTILPGAVLKSAGNYCIINVIGDGAIYAVGTADSIISFTGLPVEFKELTRDGDNLLKYCSFNGGGGHALVEFRNTATPATEDELSHVTIENCSFRNSGYCLVYITSGASPTFRDCYFTNASTGIFSHGSDTLTVEGCIFDDVSCGVVVGAYGGMFYEPMVCHIDHSTFNNIDDSREVSYLKPCKGMGICSINTPGELNVTNCIFNDIAGSGIRDWNIEDANFPENWDVTNDYNIFNNTGGDPCHMFDMGTNSLEADPLLGSTPTFALQAGSPALGAAADGSDIGAWQAYTDRGDITADETWGPSDGTITITGAVTVKSGATLTILPGSVLRTAGSNCIINVQGDGAIYAAGTADSIISFTGLPVEFKELTRDDANLLKYCSFNGGGGHALVEFRNSTTPTTEDELSHVTIENCSFRNSGYCLVYVTSGASPTFRDCYFTNASSGIFSHGSDTLTVEGCIFEDVSCGVISGALVGKRGGTLYNPMVCYVDHCVFVDIDDSRTVSGVAIAKGYGVCTVNDAGRLDVTNSIFYNIAESGIRDWNIEDPNFDENWDVTNDYNIFYQTGGDPCRMFDMGTNSLEADPLLGAGPVFTLGTGSPAIDAAADGTNMGAWQEAVSSVCPVITGDVAAGATLKAAANGSNVIFTIMGIRTGDLVVFDAAGTEVARMGVNGHQSITWSGTAAAGVYYVRLSAEPSGQLVSFIRM